MDTEAAAEAAYFFARLKLETVVRDGQVYRGFVAGSAGAGGARCGMEFTYLDERFVTLAEERNIGYGPVPAGPGGHRGSELNARMCGIFSGLSGDERRRGAAWDYILFYDGAEARRIRTEAMVDQGLGMFVRPYLLQQFNDDGRYNDLLRQQSPAVEEMYRIAFDAGVPEPYGKNCQYVYQEMTKPIGEIWRSPTVLAAIDAHDPALARSEIRRILRIATSNINRKMLDIRPAPERARRQKLSWAVILSVFSLFALGFYRLFKTFQPPRPHRPVASMLLRGQHTRNQRLTFMLLFPALASIALWMYWPLARGTLMAFQNYSVVGDSRWVGAGNFAEVLFDAEFWHSIRVSVMYALLFIVFGFWVPIVLAFVLSELPRGKVFFRVIYYLPAILSGVVVIFLWRSLYSPDGLINDILNTAIRAINLVLRTQWPLRHTDLLENSSTALFLCLLPTVWAGMGPGCLIYLAALKTVPDEIYEAADIDGAGIRAKILHVAIPSLRTLIAINFIGAMIGAVRGAGGSVLAMTGGGPYERSGGATEVIGLRLFYTTFGYLKFGTAAAMAWILGAMLIGFTVLQLRRLSRIEFRTAEKVV